MLRKTSRIERFNRAPPALLSQIERHLLAPSFESPFEQSWISQPFFFPHLGLRGQDQFGQGARGTLADGCVLLEVHTDNRCLRRSLEAQQHRWIDPKPATYLSECLQVREVSSLDSRQRGGADSNLFRNFSDALIAALFSQSLNKRLE